MNKIILILALCVCYGGAQAEEDEQEPSNTDLVTLSLVKGQSDGLKRLMRSMSVYRLFLRVYFLDEGESWRSVLTEMTEKYSEEHDVVIAIVDGPNTIFNNNADIILKNFKKMKANVVFGASSVCRPAAFAQKYPEAERDENYEFLDSGVIVGKASALKSLLQHTRKEGEGYQEYFHRLFLDSSIRKGLKLKLDTRAALVQHIDSNQDDLKLKYAPKDVKVYNTFFSTKPSIITGYGSSGEDSLLSIGNYIAKSWTVHEGCLACNENRIHLDKLKPSKYPKVLMGIFVSSVTPFLGDMLQKVSRLTYPKERIALYVYNSVPDVHTTVIADWIQKHKDEYISVKETDITGNISPGEAKHIAMDLCLEHDCDLFFNVESDAHFSNEDTLNLLVSYNRPILAPMLQQGFSDWSNFWGSIQRIPNQKSFDYINILKRKRTGIWNVPFISSAFVVWRSVMTHPSRKPEFRTFQGEDLDPDMAFALNNRHHKTFMSVVNMEEYGYMVNRSIINEEMVNSDLWQVDNQYPWEAKYIHPDFDRTVEEKTFKQVCKDVYSIPVFSEEFCQDLLDVIGEHAPEFSLELRTNQRFYKQMGISGAASLKDLGFEAEWDLIESEYLTPLLQEIFAYESSWPSKWDLVTKYLPTKDLFVLKDEPSIYTIRISLTSAGTDYQGEDWRFLSPKCSSDPRSAGEVVVYPTKALRELKQGLHVTKGTKVDIVVLFQE